MRRKIENRHFDEERALYHLQHCDLVSCVFAGKADGESVLKETSDITITDCSFSLRYPLWHTEGFVIENTVMDELTRAAIWYAKHGEINHSKLNGIKAVRECEDITICNTEILSPEFGWKSKGIQLNHVDITSEYLFFDSKDVALTDVTMEGKYSFQYMENLTIINSYLDTKDAFWHSKNVTVRDSTVKGEYLGWYSDGLTLINCHIIGTQPLCYCRKLKLVNCTMESTDFSFEYSEVDATVTGHILSVKNPKSGSILCDSVGEVIMEDAVMECNGKVMVRQ